MYIMLMSDGFMNYWFVMTILNWVGSWMVCGETIERFETSMVGVVWGGSLGCESPQSCKLWGHVWLIGKILASWIMKCLNVLLVNPFSLYVI